MPERVRFRRGIRFEKYWVYEGELGCGNMGCAPALDFGFHRNDEEGPRIGEGWQGWGFSWGKVSRGGEFVATKSCHNGGSGMTGGGYVAKIGVYSRLPLLGAGRQFYKGR